MEHQKVTGKYPTDIEALLGPPPRDGNAGPGAESIQAGAPHGKRRAVASYLSSLRPTTLDDLAGLPQWLFWKAEERGGKTTKVPYDPHTGRLASSTNPATWGTRKQAEAYAKRLRLTGAKGGVGIVLGRVQGRPGLFLHGVDLDTCIESGEVAPWAQEVIDRFKTYSEISPTKTGVKLLWLDRTKVSSGFGLGDKKAQGQTFKRKGEGRSPGMEIYLSGRYFAVTDDLLPGSSRELSEAVTHLDVGWLISEAGPAFVGKASGGTRGTWKGGSGSTDKSRSGALYRLAYSIKQRGGTFEQFEAAIPEHPEAAGHVADQRDGDRAIERAWESVPEKPDPVDALDDLTVDDDLLGPPRKPPSRLIEMNKKHAVARIGGKTVALESKADGRVEFGTVASLHEWYADDRVEVGANGATQPVSMWWMRQKGHRKYPEGVVFSPGKDVEGAYNLFQGFAIEPDPEGSCNLYLAHLRDNLCKGNLNYYEYLLNWLAHMIQHPGDKPGVAVVLRGLKGIGKDFFAAMLRRLMPQHYVHLHNRSGVTGRFNAHFERALLAHVEEAFWAGDKEAEGVLKSLITSRTLAIERKGIDPFQVDSFVRLIFSSNEDWVVPTTPDERRFFVLDCGDAQRNNRAYFDAIEAELEDGGYGKLMHLLSTRDLSAFDVGDVPETEGLIKQKNESLKEIERWWPEVFEEGRLPNGSRFDDSWSWEEGAQEIECTTLRAAYHNWLRDQPYKSRPLSEGEFGKRLRRMLPGLKRRRPRVQGEPIRTYVIPSLPECKNAFRKWRSGKE